MNGHRRFEDVLNECIALVTEGGRTVEECLALYPQWAERLEPLLRLASELPGSLQVQPPAGYEVESRQRFMEAAHARHRPAPPRRSLFPTIPWSLRFPSHVRRPALAALAVAVLALFVFPSFLFATSGDALPGEWRYPVKRASERLRFAFVFGEDDRRSFSIGLAEERLDELRGLAERGRPIDESAIRGLVTQTEPLVEDLDPQDPVALPQQHVERIEELTVEQQEVLEQVAPLVEEDAADELEQAKQVSNEGHERALYALSLAAAQGQLDTGNGTPTVGATSSPTATPQGTPGTTATPEGTATPGGEASPTGTAAPESPTPEPTLAPEATATPAPEEATATPEATPIPTPTPTARQVIPLPDDSTGGVNWSLMVIGDFSARVPNHLENGWVVSNLGEGGPEEMLFIGHRLGTAFDIVVTIRVGNGAASVYATVDGSSRRIQAADVADRAPLVADVVLHILEGISVGPS